LRWRNAPSAGEIRQLIGMAGVFVLAEECGIDAF
jgi:hypothetical protein